MRRPLAAINALLLAAFLLLAGFFSVYADHGPRSVYGGRLAQLDAAQQGRMAAIYAYLGHRTEDLSFLTAAERTHMTDVRRVIDAFTAAFLIIVVVLVIEIIIIVGTTKNIIRSNTKKTAGRERTEGRRGKKDEARDGYKRFVRNSLLAGGIAALVIVLLLACASFFDFGSFWTAFHRVLFPQGDWMFPADSALITLFPEAFFEGFAMQVLLAIGAFSLLAIGASRLICRSYKGSRR